MSSRNFTDLEQQKLPAHYADDLLELQLKVDTEQYTILVMQKLNELYRIGVQYYVMNEPRKSVYFQKKLASLLSNPRTLSLIDPNVKISRQTTVRQNMKQELQRVNSQADLCIKSMMQNAQKRLNQGQNLIKQSLESQQQRFQKRLQKVKSKKVLNIK